MPSWRKTPSLTVDERWEHPGMATALPGGLMSLPLLRRRVELVSMDMYRAGVPILAGSDALTPGEALRAATLEPARFLEATDSLGSIAEGRVADFVLLDANPLEDIRHTRKISSVVARGVVYTREELDAMLRRVTRAAS